MENYLKSNSQGEHLVQHDTPEPLTIGIANSRVVHIGIETVIDRDITLHQEVFPTVSNGKLDLSHVKTLYVNSEPCLEKETNISVTSPNDSYPKWMKIVPSVAILLVLLPGVLGAVFLFRSSDIMNINHGYYPYTNVMQQSELDYPEDSGMCFVQRNEWLANIPAESIRKQFLPTNRVIIYHTATFPCNSTEICKQIVRVCQLFHINSVEFSDIGYNFLIGGDGCVYIGRGWNYVGAHTKRYNLHSLGIALIGTFTTNRPTKLQIDATFELIILGVKLGKINENYALNGDCQLKFTASPGIFVYNIISKWKHFLVSNETPACTNLTALSSGNIEYSGNATNITTAIKLKK